MIKGHPIHRFAITLVITAMLSIVVNTALAQYPERDITIVIPYNSGGGFDSYVRALAPRLEEHLPRTVNVLPQNTPGAGGRRGTTTVYRARPDGYTIGAFNLPGVLIPQLEEMNIGYDLAQVTWLATLGDDPYVYAVNADSPIRSLAELRQAGQTIYYSATGPGSTSYIATTIVNEVLGIRYEIVTGYTGSSAYILGVIRGDVDAALVNLSAARPYIRSGDLRVLALFGAASDDSAVPDAAALGAPELGRLKLVRMIGGPPGLPAPVRQTLEAALLAALADPGFTAWLKASGNELSPAGAEATAQAVRDMSAFYESFKHLLN